MFDRIFQELELSPEALRCYLLHNECLIRRQRDKKVEKEISDLAAKIYGEEFAGKRKVAEFAFFIGMLLMILEPMVRKQLEKEEN